jgi:hypothetical protein
MIVNLSSDVACYSFEKALVASERTALKSLPSLGLACSLQDPKLQLQVVSRSSLCFSFQHLQSFCLPARSNCSFLTFHITFKPSDFFPLRSGHDPLRPGAELLHHTSCTLQTSCGISCCTFYTVSTGSTLSYLSSTSERFQPI